MATAQVSAIEGWFTDEGGAAHLLGSRCTKCHTYFFPKKVAYCRNPSCDSEDFEELKLSRIGKIWSFTNGCYQPPPPFISPDPFEPYTVVAVELAEEKIVVLGQASDGVEVKDLKVGMEAELVLETLYSDDEGDHIVWKWKPVVE